MIFDIPYLADWHNIFLVYKLGGSIGLRRQKLTDYNTTGENARRADYDYVVGRQIMIRKDGILRKSEYRYDVMTALALLCRYIRTVPSGFNADLSKKCSILGE